MAAISKTGTPSQSVGTLDNTDMIPNCIAGEPILAGDACQITGNTRNHSTVMKATTRSDGIAATDAPSDEPVSLLLPGTRIRYGKEGTGTPDIVPGVLYYLDAAVPGGLNTTANGNPVALGLTGGRLQLK